MNSKHDLIKHFAKLGFTTGAEIGVATGAFSEAMLQTIPNLKLYCIDTWHHYRGNPWAGSKERNKKNFEIATEKLTKYNAKIMREMSMEAVKKFEDESLDFVYIDANHSFDYVMADLIEWSKKVKIGGIVSGDDYYHFRKAGVIEAVDAYTKAHNIKFNLTDPHSKKIMYKGFPEQPNYWWVRS